MRPVAGRDDRRQHPDGADRIRRWNARPRREGGRDAVMGRELARENLQRVAGIDQAKRRPERKQHLAIEMRRQERLDITRAAVESRGVAGEAARGEQGRFEPQRRRIAAMGRLGHGAGIAGQAAATRRRDADRVGEPPASSPGDARPRPPRRSAPPCRADGT